MVTTSDCVVTVFGGTGFLDRRIIRHLRLHGFFVRVASRPPDRGHPLPDPDDPQLRSIKVDVRDERSVADALSDAYAVNAVSLRGPAFFTYADNYLIDVKFGIIMDVEASRAIRQAEVGAAKTMIERTERRFAIKPERLAGDTAYGSGANLNWLVNEAKIAPHIPVADKSKREDGTFSREDFSFDKEHNVYICPAGKVLTTTGKLFNDGETLYYRARTRDCRSCPLKSKCCPKAPLRRIPRSIYEEARDVARALAKTEAFDRSRRDRKREMLFAHLKRIFRLGRLRLRGPYGAQFEFTLAAIAQNLRRLAKLVVRPPPIVAACFA
jgi:hypothetical protein